MPQAGYGGGQTQADCGSVVDQAYLDLVQEALALIWRKLATLREPPRLASWATG